MTVQKVDGERMNVTEFAKLFEDPLSSESK